MPHIHVPLNRSTSMVENLCGTSMLKNQCGTSMLRNLPQCWNDINSSCFTWIAGHLLQHKYTIGGINVGIHHCESSGHADDVFSCSTVLD